MVKAQRVARLVLRDGTLQEIVPDVGPIQKVSAALRLERQDLLTNRVEEFRRNNIQGRVRRGIDG
jgi:hypothetical protein